VVVDTQDILFIGAGTFTDLRVYEDSKPVGFGAAERGPGRRRPITEKDLLDYGMLAEFLGRLPVRVELDPLSDDELYQILTVPPDAVVKEYQTLLKMDGVDLRFEEAALREVVRQAQERNTGARSLRTFLEEVCHEVMFDAPERRGETITIDASTVRRRLERLPREPERPSS
jgi:ATP-dependent Clp protease ATP-binding subunit ClpX